MYKGGVLLADDLTVWHPPKATAKPLPSEFTDIELENFVTPDEAAAKEEIISKYFCKDTVHQVRFSVAATKEWDNVKDDLVFFKFARKAEQYVSTTTMKANRARPGDRTWSRPLPGQTLKEEPEQAASPPLALALPSSESNRVAVVQTDGNESDGDQAMDMSDDDEVYEAPKEDLIPVAKLPVKPQQLPPAPPNVLDSLERVINASNFSRNNSVTGRQPSLPARARYSRSRSPEKYQAKPSNLPRDATQESVLAALGVEGSPKMMYPTPGPAVAPPDQPVIPTNTSIHAWSQPGNPALNYHSFSQPNINNRGFAYGPGVAPPPPPRSPPSPTNPWKAHGVESPKSTSSRHTAQGSDFAPQIDEDQDATPKAKVPQPRTAYERAQQQPYTSLKRPYREDDGRDDRNNGRRRQADDTPRAIRKPRYDRTDAYRYVRS